MQSDESRLVPEMSEQPQKPRAPRLAFRLFWSHTVLVAILLAAAGSMLWGLFSVNATIAEIKSEYLADFEQEELVHRAAWAVETAARHGALSCEAGHGHGVAIHAAERELARLLHLYDARLSPAMARAAHGYLGYAQQLGRGDVCQLLRDGQLDRRRLLLDEELTNSWIGKLRELRLAIAEREARAQEFGTRAIAAGLGLGALALLAAALIARSVARGVTDPLSLLATHARRLGEGDFAPLPTIREPYEVAELSGELDRMRARLAEVNQLKQAFLGSVSHDLRTPLAHMREALSLLVDGTVGLLNPKQQRVASLALRACEREIRLVSALLDLSRIRSGQPLRLSDGQQVDDIILRALESVHESTLRSGCRLQREPGAPMPALCVDAVLVETALANVLANAIAASPVGGVVRIRRAYSERDARGAGTRHGWVCIVVEDEGEGVAEALRAQIFEPFFTTKAGSEGGGVGLGLPLARDMLRAQGGELTLLQDTPRGAAFALWLPVSADRAARPAHPEIPALRTFALDGEPG